MSDFTDVEKERMRLNNADDLLYSEQIDRFISGEIPHYETVSLGHTPLILHYFGASSEKITVKQSVLKNCLLDSNNKVNHHSQGHDISENVLRQLSKAIRVPLLVIKGQHEGTLVLITELKNKENNNILVPIALDLRGTKGTVNKVTSAYGKENLLNYLLKHEKDILAIKKEKADKLFTTIGYQLSKTTSVYCFDISIAYTTKNVKPLSEYLKEISQQKGAKKMKNPFEEYGFEPFSESFDEETNRDTVYYISVNGFTYYIDLADINGRTWYWNITDSSFNPLYHDELGRAENLIAVECGDYLSEYFPLVYGFSLEDREEFMKADLARFVAKESLSSDEWESLAYPLFENNYIDKHKPSEKSILGHLGEPEVFEIARRFHNGEDIRKELALGLLDYNGDTEIVFGDDGITSSTYKYDRDTPRYKLHMEKAEDGVKLSLFDRERIVSYEEVGQTFIDMIHDEFDDLAFWWVRDDMKVAVPDISDETIRNILTAFDGAAIHGWENDQIKMNRIKKAIYDELGNEDLTEKVFACISKNKYNVSFENNNTENEGIINAAEIKKQQIIDEVFTDCKERLKYIGVETEPVRSEFAKAAEVPVDEITELLENERFVFLANDYLNGIEQISGMDAADIKAAEELLLQTTGTDMPGLRFDLYETARELFSKELEKNMEHGDQDIVFTKFHFEGDMVKLYPGRYSDVTDVPDWENVRKSLLRPENGVDDNVKVRCEQFVISCGDEREKRNERDAVSSELLILEAYFKNDPRTYELPKYLEDRLKRTYDDSEFVMMYLDPDDVVYDLLLNGEKKHTDTPEMSNSAFKGIYIMSNPRFALEQIKLNSCEWKKWDEAIMYMTDNKLSADSIDMVAVKCYDNDGRPGVKDLTPEGLYVLNQHTIKSSIAAGIARQKYEELLKSAETVSASEDSQSDSRKKNVGRK